MTKDLCSITYKIPKEDLFLPDFRDKIATICLRGVVSGGEGVGADEGVAISDVLLPASCLPFTVLLRIVLTIELPEADCFGVFLMPAVKFLYALLVLVFFRTVFSLYLIGMQDPSVGVFVYELITETPAVDVRSSDYDVIMFIVCIVMTSHGIRAFLSIVASLSQLIKNISDLSGIVGRHP